MVGAAGRLTNGFTLNFRLAKNNFFDRQHIRRQIRAAGQDPARLDRAARYVQQAARSSMRTVSKRTTYSAPGRPPNAHVKNQAGNLIRRKSGIRGTGFGLKVILRAWSPIHRGAIVGPVGPTRGRNFATTVPEAHEFGRSLRIEKPDPNDRRSTNPSTPAQRAAFFAALAAGKVKNRPRRRITYTAHYPARPFMRPALMKTLPKLPSIWKNSIVSSRVTP